MNDDYVFAFFCLLAVFVIFNHWSLLKIHHDLEEIRKLLEKRVKNE